MFKFVSIPIFGNIIFWLAIQLLNPQMKWMVFYIFGIGITIFTFLIALIAYLKTYQDVVNRLIIYDKVIVVTGAPKHYITLVT